MHEFQSKKVGEAVHPRPRPTTSPLVISKQVSLVLRLQRHRELSDATMAPENWCEFAKGFRPVGRGGALGAYAPPPSNK